MVKLSQKFERNRTSQLNSKGLVAHVPSFFLSPHPSPLSQPVHGERKAFLAVTTGLLAAVQLPGPVHFLAQHVHGHVTTQCHLCQLPILQEKRDLATRPIQPDDVQRLVTYVAFSSHWKTLFRPPTKLRHHSPILDSLGSPFSIPPPDLENDIHHRHFLLQQLRARQRAHASWGHQQRRGEYGCRHWRKARKVSLSGTIAGSFWIRKKKELSMRPVLPWHIPPHGCCAQTHHPSDPSRAKHPPRSAFPTKLWRKPTPAIARHSLHKALGPTPPVRILHTPQGFVQCHTQIFEVVFPKWWSGLVSPPRGIVVFSPASLAAFIFQRAFAFWASCGFLTPTALLISL